MKIIILCAGKGTRMGFDFPKCLLDFNGKTLLSYQLKYAQEFKLYPVVITGYKKDMLGFPNTYHNPDYEKTNMVESLMCAKEEFDDDIIVSYGDIYYNKEILGELIKEKGDFVVTVDALWENYWKLRYGTLEKDLESLKIDGDRITEIGKPNPSPENIYARFVGLVKFSKKGILTVVDVCETDPTFTSHAYTTDLLQLLIDKKFHIRPYIVKNGWLEFDTKEDYEKSKEWTKWLNLSI